MHRNLATAGGVEKSERDSVHDVQTTSSTQVAASLSEFHRLLLTQEAVAALLRVHRTTVWRWAQDKRLNAVELLPGLVRFRTAEILAFAGLPVGPPSADALVCVADAIFMLSIDRTTLWRLRKLRCIDAVVVGRRSVRFRTSDLLRLADAGHYFRNRDAA